jgi:hypothetical protein
MKRKAALWSIVLAASAASGAVLAQTSTTEDGPAPQAAPTAPVASAPLAPPPATPPPLPPQPAAGTTPSSVVTLVETVCQPLIAGQDEKTVARAAGLRKSRLNWVLKAKGAPTITLTAPTEANPHACILVLDIQPGESQPLVDGLAWWAGTRAPPMKPFDTGYQSGGITSWSWTYDSAERHQGFALSVTQGGGSRGADEATVLYSDRPQ